MHYAGTPIHRVIPGFMAQGGDTWAGDGSGGESIYGETFEDETFALGHDARGVLAMANAGPHTTGSQWYLTFKPCPWLDGKHVVFGKVVGEASFEVLSKLEAEGSRSGATRARCAVVASGVVEEEAEERGAAAAVGLGGRAGIGAAGGAAAGGEARGGGAGGGGGRGEQEQEQQRRRQQQKQQEEEEEEEEQDDGPTDAEYAALNPRQRRLADVKRRLAAARRANVAAAVA